ncbi:PAN-1 domain and Apple-like domain-containing protein [Strongyloides ratti]|uniref:PAN-1 domain and Apple-like domain-containing protein n=1 Tax=Strongyloides ratti TaxID=34506 RepID=A0A090LEE0_STRRB|nr:PAN-1 domain and Apple-like domain-containing protein [Strongyloides ratti]CEF66513.1 PAN-1 domain and Apple-like domain-containing protein [Strongyloides ratti]
MYNKESLDRGNFSVSGFSSTSIYNNYEYNIRTGNNTSLNDLVKHNAILQHMPMFDYHNTVKNTFVTSIPTTLTIKKAFIKRIRKKFNKNGKLKIFNKSTKKQDSILNLPEEEKKINFSVLLNDSLTKMGYMKGYDYKSHEIRKLQPHIKKFTNNDIQRVGVYFNEASIPSLINVDNDITQYEDINKVTSTTMKITTISNDIIEKYLKSGELKNLNRGITNFVDESNTNLPFTVTETFEKEFDSFTDKEKQSKINNDIKNKSILTLTRTLLPPLEDKSLLKTSINNEIQEKGLTKESKEYKLIKTEDDRDSFKMLKYFKEPQQHLTFITKSLINGIEENSVKKVISGGKNTITLPNILLPSLNKDNINYNKVERIENTHDSTFINNDNLLLPINNNNNNNNKNYAFGSLIQPIIEENYYDKYDKDSTQKPYIFDIPAPVQLPTSKILSSNSNNIINNPKIQEKIVMLKNLNSNKNMIIGENLLNYHPNDLYYLNKKKNNEIRKDNVTPIQFGSIIIDKEKPSSIIRAYNDEDYHSNLLLECFDIKENFYITTLKSKERRINVSEKECGMFCASHSDCLFITYHKKLKICDLYVIENNKDSEKHMFIGNEKKLIQKYGIQLNGVNLFIPLRNNGGVGNCIKKIYDEEKNLNNEDGYVIDSEELQFMNSNMGESKMKEKENDKKKIKNKALGSTMFIVHSENNSIPKELMENWKNTLNNDKLLKLTKEVSLNNNNTFYESFSIFNPCSGGKKLYYIKSEGHQLKEDLSKSIIQQSNLIECQKACSENFSLEGFNITCSSFSYNFIKKECQLHENGSNFESSNHLIKNENFNHYESVCLYETLVEKCQKIKKYPIRKKQTILIGYAIDSFKFSNIQECMGKCLTNEDCQSITYFHDNEDDNCVLNSENSISDVNSFIEVQNPNSVDFFSFSNCQKKFSKNQMGVI